MWRSVSREILLCIWIEANGAVPLTRQLGMVVPLGPLLVTMGPMVTIELERVEVLELLGMALAHLMDAEARVELSPRVALLMAIRDKLALALREEL